MKRLDTAPLDLVGWMAEGKSAARLADERVEGRTQDGNPRAWRVPDCFWEKVNEVH